VKKKEIQLIAVDMDGTLLDPAGNLPSDTVAYFRGLKKRKIAFTLVSGRPILFMEHIAQELEITLPMVAFNGGALFNGKEIYRASPFSMASLQHVLEEAARIGATVLYYTAWEAFSLTTTSWIIKNKGTVRKFVIHTPTQAQWQDLEILKIALVYHHRPGAFEIIDPLLAPFEQDFSINRYGNRSCEIMQKGITKATGLRALSEHTAIPLSKILAIGDDTNDIEMIRQAGIGVAVSNAKSEVKEAADHVTLKSNTNGVIEAIERFGISEVIYP
jgi:Cof subfamily protein (haloacid dehalogenase superfamily)